MDLPPDLVKRIQDERDEADQIFERVFETLEQKVMAGVRYCNTYHYDTEIHEISGQVYKAAMRPFYGAGDLIRVQLVVTYHSVTVPHSHLSQTLHRSVTLQPLLSRPPGSSSTMSRLKAIRDSWGTGPAPKWSIEVGE